MSILAREQWKTHSIPLSQQCHSFDVVRGLYICHGNEINANAMISNSKKSRCAYLVAINVLLEDQGRLRDELATKLDDQTNSISKGEHVSYRPLMTALANFYKFASQNRKLVIRTGHLSKMRICMLLNQYVLSDAKVKDAIVLARRQMKDLTGIDLPKLILAGLQQLKTDLIALKETVLDVDEFEHFATNMAIIKVNHILSTDLRTLRRNEAPFQYFDMIFDSPNETKITSTKLNKSSNTNPNRRKSSTSQADIVIIEQLRVHVGKLKFALQALETSVKQFALQNTQCSILWWHLLGNNQYDYGVECYMNKCHRQQQQLIFLSEKLHKSTRRWQQLECEMRNYGKPPSKQNTFRQRMKKNQLNSVNAVNAVNATHQNSFNSFGHEVIPIFLGLHTDLSRTPPYFVSGVKPAMEQFRNVFLTYANMELHACVQGFSDLLAEFVAGSQSQGNYLQFQRNNLAKESAGQNINTKKYAVYADIVHEYNVSVGFMARMMETAQIR